MSRRTPAPAVSPAARTGVAAAALLLVLAGGCSRGDTHHEPGTGHEVATGSVPPATDVPDRGADGSDAGAGTTVEIAVRDGRVSPAPGRVEVGPGERVTLRVTSDTDDELHVHGYDETAVLRAGEPAELAFTADRTGIFDVETHGSGLVLTQLMVR
ncbi:hypothetical protein O7599_10605 [Streptomyces sp. WMMC500]|uniref:hypothetical protein n=1 Tax=Streptomyces sp. WMMC500 TaxID=3015154 RepID=UPI00248C8398|nr:hypothetical protein [Streptomyces sp. WMMC500]WBB62945.1 hypothetical protein O7599_10605 [Streptomyces sp. WMMC500]